MRRWHAEAQMLRLRQLFYANHFEGEVDTQHPMGRFRKIKVYDCGRTKCHLCHAGKIFGWKTEAMRIADEVFIDQVEEFKAAGGIIVRR